MSQAVLDNQRGGDPVGRPSLATLQLYRKATDSMRTTLTGVQRLTSRDHDVLDATYASESGPALAALGGVVVVGLIGLQVLLRRWLRRTVNPALVLPTGLAVALTVGSIGVLSGAAGQLKVAKLDAFDSIIALSQARAVSYDANADESRFLVGLARASRYLQAFHVKSLSLVDLRAGLSQFDRAFASALRAY